MTRSRCERSQRDESGETLLEILIALVILSITVLAITSAFTTAIASSARHKSLAQISALLRSYAEAATFQIQFQPSPLYTSCATAATYQGLLTGMPSTTNITLSWGAMQYWNGTSWSSSCTSGSTAPQMITLTASGTYNQSQSLSFSVASFAYAATSQTSPVFASASTYSTASGSAFTFSVVAGGTPAPQLTASGLPSWAQFTDNHDGTGTLSNISGNLPVAGTYPITITANNSVGTAATQNFTLVITQPPVITSADNVTWTHGKSATFTITATGVPTPSFSSGPANLSGWTSGLPPGVTLTDNGNGTATIGSGASKLGPTTGQYVISIIANSGSSNTSQTFKMTIN